MVVTKLEGPANYIIMRADVTVPGTRERKEGGVGRMAVVVGVIWMTEASVCYAHKVCWALCFVPRIYTYF